MSSVATRIDVARIRVAWIRVAWIQDEADGILQSLAVALGRRNPPLSTRQVQAFQELCDLSPSNLVAVGG